MGFAPQVRGTLWKIEDYSGNELVWEQPEIFCIESLQIRKKP